ncbi:MAG: NADH pyrophosphatase [Chlamydiales bacterium]|nr:NADH pyrophosphatase [Chlamydiales bacterium]
MIFSSPKGYMSEVCSQNLTQTRWYIFHENSLLVSADNTLPDRQNLPLKRDLYFGSYGHLGLFAGEAESSDISGDWTWIPLRSLFGRLNEADFSLAGRALQLLHWDRSHTYCGVCGSKTLTSEKERCRRCPDCEHLAYPKLSPVIMALVKKKDQILLARGSHFPENFYSVLAGYVEPGETLEQCVAREIEEEVDIHVQNIRYFGSQPWPFSNSLMMAFTCEWKEGEIVINKEELIDAGWFYHNNLPPLPSSASISRHLIESAL